MGQREVGKMNCVGAAKDKRDYGEQMREVSKWIKDRSLKGGENRTDGDLHLDAGVVEVENDCKEVLVSDGLINKFEFECIFDRMDEELISSKGLRANTWKFLNFWLTWNDWLEEREFQWE